MLRTVDRGERVGAGPLAVLLAAVAVLGAGCAQTVPGTPYPEGAGPSSSGSTTAEVSPPTAFAEPSGRPTVTVQPEPVTPGAPTSEPVVPRPLPEDPAPGGTPASPTGGPASPGPDRPAGRRDPPAGASAPLTADVISDECLLDAPEFAALLGVPVEPPAQSTVTRPDGSRTRSCYATGRTGSPTGAINVYRVNRGTPASFVRAAAGGRPVSGVGEAAVLLETVGGSALQIATPRFLITVGVVDGAASEQRWRAAGRAAVDAVGRR